MSNQIGQYYYKCINGAGGRVKITPGFDDFDKVFCKRGAFSEGGFAPSALLYDRVGENYFVAKEEITPQGDDLVAVRHGFLFPAELFEKSEFGAKLYRFFDIDDFDCTPEGYDKEETLSALPRIHVAGDCCDFLRPEDVFRQCREHIRFIKLLFYGALIAVTDEFSLVFSIPERRETPYYQQAVLLMKSLMAMIPWKWREYLSFHTCVDDPLSLGSFKLCATPLPVENLPKNNRTFYFDLKTFRVSPDLVIEQKTRGTISADLLYQIWMNEDEKALSALFYIVHHNREILSEGTPRMVEIDALSCFFLLTEVGEKYRRNLSEELGRLSKGARREILLFLAGHLENREFLKLRELLHI